MTAHPSPPEGDALAVAERRTCPWCGEMDQPGRAIWCCKERADVFRNAEELERIRPERDWLRAQLAAVGPVVAAARAVVERWNESNWIQDDTRDYSAPFADTIAALASAVREMGEQQ